MNNTSLRFVVLTLVLLQLPSCAALSNLISDLTGVQLPTTAAASNYSPSPQVLQLANAATMTDKAKGIFFGAQPVIDSDRAAFDQHCQAPISSTAVELGCYTSDNRIYILEIGQPQLSEEMVVVAAHEMLHAAYAQLPASEIATLNGELEAEVPLIHSRDLNQVLRDYRATEPGQRDNELHSILGTEYSPLVPSLENYYSQYFTNRMAVVSDARQFDQVFLQLKIAMSNLQTQIANVHAQMQADLRRRNIAGYNALVPTLNNLVVQYNRDVVQYNSLSRSLLQPEPLPTPQ